MDRTWILGWFLASLVATPAWAAPANSVPDGVCDNRPIEHTPAADVAYQGGITADGWAIAPADATAPSEVTQELMNPSVSLEVPLENYVDQSQYNYPIGESRIQLGTLTLNDSHQPLINGKSLLTPDPDCVK